MGADSFLYEMTPIYMGGNNENDRVAFPESIPIHLNNITVLLLENPETAGFHADHGCLYLP